MKSIKPMKKSMTETIIQYFAPDRRVIAVYLFGSQARGKAKSASDVDLAVLLAEKPDFDYRLKAMDELSGLLQKPVDVVIIDQCGLIMQRQVLKYGILLYELDSRKRKAFEILSRKMYLDFLPAHRLYVSKMEERILRRVENGR